MFRENPCASCLLLALAVLSNSQTSVQKSKEMLFIQSVFRIN
jgi:hypothetical protein